MSLCVHCAQVGTSTNCYTGDGWDASLCPDPDTCSKNCALDGASYQSTYGITTSGDSATFKLVTVGQVSRRVPHCW
jgi:cellulose 1,4-beta-cellobiosidase